MTEQDWLTSDNPAAMLAQFVPPGGRSSGLGVELQSFPISDRKLRLLAVACCRSVFHLLTDDSRCLTCHGGGKDWQGYIKDPCRDCGGTGRVNRSRRAVEVAERFADGLATAAELVATHDGAHAAWSLDAASNSAGMARYAALVNIQHAVSSIVRPGLRGVPSQSDMAALLREVVGNPWRPVRRCDGGGPGNIPDDECDCLIKPWLTPAVLAMARSAYEERVDVPCGRCLGGGYCGSPAPGTNESPRCPDCHGSSFSFHGAFDPGTLAVLSDELEIAGCTDEFLLSHLRGLELTPDVEMPNKYRWQRLRTPHVRGCWAVDALLGKG